MSQTSSIGVLGVAHQSGKGTANTSFTYIPATNLGLNAQQTVNQLPLEISGDVFPLNSYKTGVSTGGSVSIQVRPDSFGLLLLGLCGQDTVTPVPSQSGAYSHVMVPYTPNGSNDLPWLTTFKSVGRLWGEQYVDTKVSGIRLDIAKQSIVNSQVSLFGITPSETTPYSTGTPDSGPLFQTCQTTVSLQQEGQGTNISAQSVLVERVSLDFQTRLSQDEYVVGSYVPADVTLLSRAVQISYDIVIRDAALRRAVYQNGGTSAWSPTVYRGHLNLVLASNTNVASTTQPYQMTIDLPGIDFAMMPVTMQAGELIRANLSAHVTLGPSGTDKFTFTTINATASY